MLLGLLIVLLIVLGGISIVWVIVLYNEGLNDASTQCIGYDNKHSGFAAWLYDQGYNADAARQGRKQRNLERNAAKREGRG